MSALTRIFNNQIFNATIVASQKIAPGTITGSLFSSNVTVPGDLLIAGNLFVLGTSAYTTIASTNTYVNDPLVLLNNGFSGTNTRDMGLVFNRGTDQNQAIIWSEVFDEFRLIATNETGTTYGNINAAGLARLSIGSLVVPGQANIGSAVIGGAISGASLNVSGNVLASTVGASFVTASTAAFGNISAVSFGNTGATFSGASLNVSGNVLASTVGASFVTASTAAFGNIAAGIVGNVGTQFNGSSINLSGNVLAAGGVFNGVTVNGNETVTGFLNVTGNVIAANVTASYFVGNGALLTGMGVGYGNIQAKAYTETMGFTNYSNVNVKAYTETIGFTNYSNVNVASYLSTATINTTGNILAAAGTFNVLTVNGNETVTGFLNVTGNILGATGTLSILGVSNNFYANASIATTTQGTGAIVVPNGGISVSGAANIAGAITTAGAAQFNNTLTVGGVTQVTNTTNSTDATGTTGALRVAGGGSIAKDLWVGGNLYAANIIGVTANVITVQDPLLYLAPDHTFPYDYDIGFFSAFTGTGLTTAGNILQHTGIVRHNDTNTWTFASNLAAPSAGHLVLDSNTVYDPIKAGNLELATNIPSTSTTTGALIVAGGAGIAGTVVAGQLNSTGNVLGQAGTFNALTVNGGITSTGYFNTSGNISTAQLNAGQINTTGNVSAAVGVFGAINSTGYINTSGNISTAQLNAGQINTTGNVLASTIGASFLTASTAAVGNISAVNIGNAGATLTGTTGTFGAVNSGFIGNTGTAFTGASINLSGNVLASSILTNFLSVDDVVFGNVSAAVFGNVGAVFTGASINLSGNVLASTVQGSFLTASTAAVGNISAVTIGNAGATVTGTTAAFSGNVIGGLAQFASINATPVGNASASTGAFTTLSASQGIWANSTTASTSTTTGAIVVAGGVGIAGNVRAGGGAVFNSSQTADPFQVRGVATTSLIYADTANGGVIIGGSNTAAPLGMTLKVNGTDSMLLPIGTTGQRPSSTGNVDIAGMIRYNSTIQDVEYYNGTTWAAPGSGQTPTITDRQFAGNVAGGFGNVDGTNTVFTIQSNSTTAGTVVSINGVIQFPVLAYAVSGTTLTFTEPPAPDDVIDVRVMAAASTVTSIASDNGYNQFIASASAAEIWTGVALSTKQIQVNPVGDVEYLTGGKTTYTQPVINIAANNTPYVISTWNQTSFVTAKYLISAKRGTSNYQSMEAVVTTDQAGNAYITTYAVVSNGVDMGGLTANVVGGNVRVYWTTTTNITNANVKAMGTFIV